MIEKRLAETDNTDGDAEEYVKRIKRYANGEKLTREMCLQIIDFITVGEKNAENGEREVNIYYKFQGDFRQ